MRSLRSVSIKPGMRVLVRVDWNVPIGSDGDVNRTEDYKIKRSLPTLEYLLKRKARLILATHLGRPNGKPDDKFKLHPIKRRGQYLLGRPIHYIHDVSGVAVEEALHHTDPHGVVLLENLRFYPEEEVNDVAWAKKIAQCADLYVNDAFGVSHRAHASVSAITKSIKSVAGLLLEQEVQSLERVLHKSKHPYLVFLGGAKILGKIDLVEKLCALADNVVVGGGIANTLLACRGLEVGKSMSEYGQDSVCQVLFKGNCQKKLLLPSDVVVGGNLGAKTTSARTVDSVEKNDVIADIGPKTVKAILPLIQKAKTIVWNGPLGYTENPKFAKGSRAIAEAIAKSKAFSVAGGGETVSMLVRYGLVDDFSFVSTGGGAMIEYLEGRIMPGIDALMK